MNTFEIVRMIGEAPKELFNFNETSILTRMAFFADREGKNISPGLRKLSRETKLSRKPLINTLNSLVKKGAIIVCCERAQGSNDHSCYDINVSLLKSIGQSNNNEEKSYVNSLKSEKKSPIQEEKIPQPGVSQTPGYLNICYQPGVSQTPGGCLTDTRGGVSQTPLPYTPYLEPISTYSSSSDSKLDAVLAAIEKKSKKSPKKKNSWTPEVLEVFEHWKLILEHPRAKLDEHRRKYIVRMLEADYSVDDLKLAIDGVKKTPHNMGDNPSKRKYDEIDIIFRNSKQVERFIRNFDTREAPIREKSTTASNLSFNQRDKQQVNMLKKMKEKYFPELSDNSPNLIKQINLIENRQEHEINERK